MILACRTSRRASLVGTLCLTLAGCSTSAEAEVPIDELPTYTREEARLYDDSIAMEVFESEQAPTPTGALFEDRVRAADLIAPVRLVGIDAEKSDETVRYQLVAKLTDEPLTGSVNDDPLRLAVGRGSPSQAMLEAMDTQLVGVRMLVLARRYQRDGEMVMHFRSEPDTVATRDAVRKALAENAEAANATD